MVSRNKTTVDYTGYSRDEIIRTALENPYQAIAVLGGLSLHEFVQCFWNEVSDDELKLNWHMEYLCGQLTEIAERVGNHEKKLHDLIINIPPGTTKPVWEEMLVLMGDGSYKKLKEIVVGDSVINMKGMPTKVKKVHTQGLQPSLNIKTNGGREIYLAIDHPILTTKGWKNAEDLIVGDYAALMHTQKIEDTSNRSIDEFKLAGYLIGDGSVSATNCSLCGTEMDYLDDAITCIKALNFDYYKFVDKNGVTVINLKANKADGSNVGKYKGRGRGYKELTGPRKWIQDIGITGKTSKTKIIPDFVFKGSDEKVAAFLATYFQCDGTVSYKHGDKRNLLVSMCTISEELAKGLQQLFLRVGVPMKIRKRVSKNGFTYNRDLKNYVSYTIETYNQDAASIFLEKIPITGYKLTKLEGFVPQKRTFKQEFWPDEIVEIESVGDLKCRCLTVADAHSFVVDGIVVHNTIICSIMFPVWCWTRWHWMRFITGSYSSDLSLESAEKSRDIMRSDKFKLLYPDIIIKEDKDTKSNYRIALKMRDRHGKVNRILLGGGRFSTSTGGTITGFHGHINIWDDPLNPKQAVSDALLKIANDWITQSASTRKADKDVSVTIMVMQRLHQNDPTGHMLEKVKDGKMIKHICLPGEIRNYREQLNPPELAQFYKDELLDPVRLSWSALKEMMADLGQYGFAGQVGQHPTPPGGGMFKVDNFQIIDHLPSEIHQMQVMRYWDKAGTEGAGKYTAGVKILKLANKRWVVLDVRRGRWSAEKRERIIRQTAEMDGVNCEIGIEQEPGSGGKESAEATIRNLAGFIIHKDLPKGEKELRAKPFAVQVNEGNVMLLRGEWNHDFIEEYRFFPFGNFKDQVDAASAAFNLLASKRIAGRIT